MHFLLACSFVLRAAAFQADAADQRDRLFAWFDQFGITQELSSPVVDFNAFPTAGGFAGAPHHETGFLTKHAPWRWHIRTLDLDAVVYDRAGGMWFAEILGKRHLSDAFVDFAALSSTVLKNALQERGDLRWQPERPVVGLFALARAARSRGLESLSASCSKVRELPFPKPRWRRLSRTTVS